MSFIKSFGLGILYFLLSPFILVGCVIVGIFGIFNFLVQGFIMLINFFKGKKLFPRFKEDEEAYNLQLAQYEIKSGMAEAKARVAQQGGNTYIQNNYYQTGPAGVDPTKIAGTPFQQIPNPGPIPQVPNNQQYGQVPYNQPYQQAPIQQQIPQQQNTQQIPQVTNAQPADNQTEPITIIDEDSDNA